MSKNFVTDFIGGKQGGTGNVGTGLGDIKAGDMLVVNAQTSAVLTGGGNDIDNAPEIAIAYAYVDGMPIVSSTIYGRKMANASDTAFRAKSLQVSELGYSATNPGLTLPAEGEDEQVFSGAIVFPTDLRIVANRQDRIEFEAYSKGGYDLAAKWSQDINRDSDENPKLGKLGYVHSEVTVDGTAANIGTSATATVHNGSKKVTFSSAHGLAAGDYVVFPGAGAYTVASVTSTTVIVLDYPYGGLSTVHAADTAKKHTSVTKFGLKISANEIVYTNPVDRYNQIKFEVGVSENAEVSEVVATPYDPGTGEGWHVRGKEIDCMGWKGYTDRNNTKRQEFPFSTNINAKYNVIEMASIAPVRGDMQQSFEGPTAVCLAFDNAASTQYTALKAILAPWLASAGVPIT